MKDMANAGVCMPFLAAASNDDGCVNSLRTLMRELTDDTISLF